MNKPKLHKKGPPRPTWSAAKCVRSYKLDEDVVVDHRTGRRASARRVLDGDIDIVRTPVSAGDSTWT